MLRIAEKLENRKTTAKKTSNFIINDNNDVTSMFSLNSKKKTIAYKDSNDKSISKEVNANTSNIPKKQM